MGARDLLDHQAARPETIVPGRWLLDLEHEPTIVHVRRYANLPSEADAEAIPAAESSSDASRRAAARLKVPDMLDAAWRAVNADGVYEGSGVVREVMKSPCAIIVPPRQGDRAMKRELWVFEVGQQDDVDRTEYVHDALVGLQRIPHLTPSFSIPDMLSCSIHGPAAACTESMTASSSTPCRVIFRPGQHAYEWDLLCRAVVEKLSWRAGRRVSMMPSMTGERCPIKSSLSPFGANQLLLRVQPAFTENPASSHTSAYRTLQPLSLPAHFIAHHQATSEQLIHLEDTFATALGPAWAGGRSTWRLAQQSLGRSTDEWGIYWVPVGSRGAGMTAAMSPGAINAGDTEGIMTIWPSHLVFDPTPSLPHASTARKKRKRRVARVQPEEPSDMLGLASGLFDFFATYTEPPPPEEAVEDSSTELAIPPILEAGLVREDREGSDTDGLFSDRSPTPEPGQNQAPYGELPQNGSIDAEEPRSPPRIVIDDEDVDMTMGMSNGNGPSPPQVYSSKVSSVGMDDMNGVTEDDFDFFDSPPRQSAVESEVTGEAEETIQPREPNEEKSVKANGDANGDASKEDVVDDTPVHVKDFAYTAPPRFDAIQDDGAPEAVEAPDVLSPVEETEEIDAIEDIAPPAPNGIAMIQDDIHLDSFDTSPTTIIDPSPKPSDISDLIPPDFSPLPLEPIRLSASLRLPTSGDAPPTIQTLRSELLARLKEQYNKDIKVDYHAGWKMNDEQSEDEAEEIGTDAPSTPASSDMWDDSAGTSGDEKEVVEGSADVEYDGVPCIGAEWFVIHEGDTLGGLRRRWKDAWGELPHSEVAVVEEKKPEGMDSWERMAREIICNRYYRQARPTVKPKPTADATMDEGSSLDHLVTLTTDSATCTVHAGFAGNVIQLAIAGLSFWRQLGLSPVGGEKDVKSVAICLPGDGNMQVADILLKGVERAWNSLRLGRHIARTQSRVVISDVHSIANSINLLLQTHPKENLVIYIMLDRARIHEPALMSALSSTQAPPNQAVHIIPTDSMHTHDFANIAMDVYNRVYREIEPFTPYRLTPPPLKAEQWFPYPSFTLAPDTTPRPELSLVWPMRSYDVMNRWRWLHVGYVVAQGHLVAFASDAEGESWDVGVWTGDLGDLFEHLWTFVVAFSTKVAIEWRVALVRLGVPDSEEMMALERLAESTTEPITTVFVEPAPATSGSLVTPVPPANVGNLMTDLSSALIDEALATRIGRFQYLLPVSVHSAREGPVEEVYPTTSWTMTIATSSNDHLTSTYHLLSHRPAMSKADEVIEEVLGREYQKLTYLARWRFGWVDAGLPVQLQAVRAVGEGIGLLKVVDV